MSTQASQVVFYSFLENENGEKVTNGEGAFLCNVSVDGVHKVMSFAYETLVDAGIIIPSFEVANNSSVEEPITEATTKDTTSVEAASTLSAASSEPEKENHVLQERGKNKEIEWGTQETKLLLDKYEEYLKQVGPMKKFKNKKAMWHEISENLENLLHVKRTAAQCENRYKTILKRKKTAVIANRQTGGSRNSIEYEEELNKIAAVDDTVQPEVLRGIGQVIVNEKRPPCSSQENISAPKKRRVSALSESLLQINMMKEEARERRHKEKMNLIRELFCTKD